jgi:cysteine-rich repeat protein
VACTSFCEIDARDCELCGNGIREGSEQCDGNDVSVTCEDELGPGAIGQVACTSFCQISTNSCQRCGNGIREGTEACDDGNQVDDDLCSNACAINTPC